MSLRADAPLPGLRGGRLLVARVAWVAVAVAALVIVLFSVPSSLEHFRSVCTVASEVCSERAVGQPTPEGVRALQDAGLSLSTYAFLNVAVDKVADFVWIAVGALIFLRRSDDRMALLVSLFLVTFWTTGVDPTDAEVLVSSQPAWWLPVQGAQIVGSICSMLFFLLFPGGRFMPRWTRWLAVADVAYFVPQILFPDLYSRSPALEGISYMVFLGFVVSITWSLVYRYRRVSSAEQRRQTRWVVFGVALAIAGSFVFQLPVDLQLIGADTPFVLLLFKIGFTLSFLLIPLSVGVAVVSSHLFDIDVLINRTLVYGALTVMLALVYFGGVVGLQRLLSPIVGESNQLATVASTLAIAALFNPLRHRVQAFVDRRFYRRKYDARKTLETFSTRLRDATDLDALNSDLLEVVKETVQPAHVSLWLRPETAPGEQADWRS
ncbi:MAG: hypothetical protein M3338_05420 [Actinomycetota bacterium]|nr:hypothetical protein [Actinomycetota bacterium]